MSTEGRRDRRALGAGGTRASRLPVRVLTRRLQQGSDQFLDGGGRLGPLAALPEGIPPILPAARSGDPGTDHALADDLDNTDDEDGVTFSEDNFLNAGQTDAVMSVV